MKIMKTIVKDGQVRRKTTTKERDLIKSNTENINIKNDRRKTDHIYQPVMKNRQKMRDSNEGQTRITKEQEKNKKNKNEEKKSGRMDQKK